MSDNMSETPKRMNKEELESALKRLGLGPLGPPKRSLKTPAEKVQNYKIMVHASITWSTRKAYLEVIQNFLLKKIDGKTFRSEFLNLRTQNMIRANEVCRVIEDGIFPVAALDLYYNFKASDFSSALDEFFFELDRYDPDLDNSSWDATRIVYSENQLRWVIQKEFVPRFQQSCDLDDSFFLPQVDLD